MKHVAHYLKGALVFASGCAIGAMLAVALGRLDPSGDVLKLYVGAMTVLLGGVLGLTSARTMDNAVDDRRRRRRARLNVMKIERLEAGYRHAVIAVSRWQMLKNLAPDADSPIEVEPEELRACVRTLCFQAQDPPNFEDMIDTPTDYTEARNVLLVFAFASNINNGRLAPDQSATGDELIDWANKAAEALSTVHSTDQESLVERHFSALRRARRHFGRLI